MYTFLIELSIRDMSSSTEVMSMEIIEISALKNYIMVNIFNECHR